MKIKAISLWEPFASLVAWGAKHNETRSWQWPGDLLPDIVAIHAARRWGSDVARMCQASPFSNVLREHGVSVSLKGRPNLPFGCVVCVARVRECVATLNLPLARGTQRECPQGSDGFSEHLDYAMARHPIQMASLAGKYLEHCPNERHFGDYRIGRYAWSLDSVQRLEVPVPATGRQSVWQWEVPKELEDTVRRIELPGR